VGIVKDVQGWSSKIAYLLSVQVLEQVRK